ncbi:hypothetical protein [Cohnella kolymensis]|nr:hypothetical protein [Cohnella kolymensis]
MTNEQPKAEEVGSDLPKELLRRALADKGLSFADGSENTEDMKAKGEL